MGLADRADPLPRAEVLVVEGSGVVRSSYIRNMREEKVNIRCKRMRRGRKRGSNMYRAQDLRMGWLLYLGSIIVDMCQM